MAYWSTTWSPLTDDQNSYDSPPIGERWRTYWLNSMVDYQEGTWISLRPWTTSNRGTADSRRETILRRSTSTVQPVSANEPEVGALRISMLGACLRGVSKTHRYHICAPAVTRKTGEVHKTVEEHLRKAVTSHQGAGTWDYPSSSLPTGHPPMTLRAWPQLMSCSGEKSAYQATRGTANKKWTTIDHTEDLVNWLHDIHNYAHQHLQAGQWSNENPLRLAGKLRRLPRGRWSVAVSLNPHQRKVTQASTLMEGPT
jgi:hypothetical protein